jgi:hypothetical protein
MENKSQENERATAEQIKDLLAQLTESQRSFDEYGHCNFGKLARAMTEQARLHPPVVQLETFSFAPRLASLRDSQITQEAVDAAASNAGEALQRLLELIQPTNA